MGYYYSVIPGRCKASNPESRDSGSGANAPSRNDEVWIASSLPPSLVELRRTRALLAMTAVGSRRHHLIADDEEFDQVHPAKTRGQRHVGGVAPRGHQDAADPRMIVTGVERVPLPREID